ncbi:CapA family protein [Qipengyuania sp. NPDC077563]|uniref:CapA family protein n=1 Tax=Qipengyuania sp. NPDC077563 TaxID=3364497 RepID=UPI00384DE912
MNSIELLFGGDFAPNERYISLIKSKKRSIFGSAEELLRSADLAICNLEAPICKGYVPILKSGPSMRSDILAIDALVGANIGAVSLANNHIFDYGSPGLSSTMSLLDQRQIAHVGAGLNREEAELPLRLVVKGKNVSLISAAEKEFNVDEGQCAGAAILDPIQTSLIVRKEKETADAVIVYFHGGNEFFPFPRPGLRRMCQFFIEMGADAVIGHHSHVPGGYEIFNGRPIVYGLGNLIFDHVRPPPGWNEGYFAKVILNFDNDERLRAELEIVPYTQSVGAGGLNLLTGQERLSFIARIEAMRDELENLPQKWLAHWHEFVSERQVPMLLNLISPIRFPGLRRLLRLKFLRKLLFPESRRLNRLNLLRCDSHREVIIDALSRQLN